MKKWSSSDLDQVRREYKHKQLDESTMPSDPIELFMAWLEEATGSGIPDPTAMTLSTVDQNGAPSSRVVLLKKIHHNSLVFFTNYHSRKAKEIRNNQKVAAHFYWPELERQVKISGMARPIEDKESDSYFSSRPFESKISAWASPQSEMVPDRDYLENEYIKYLEKYKDSGEVPRPAHWGGFAIEPIRIEFWQGGRYRLHDRIEYTLKEKAWSRVRLAP
jgi:pyridoxamine 5'-phosphate oxidase